MGKSERRAAAPVPDEAPDDLEPETIPDYEVRLAYARAAALFELGDTGYADTIIQAFLFPTMAEI